MKYSVLRNFAKKHNFKIKEDECTITIWCYKIKRNASISKLLRHDIDTHDLVNFSGLEDEELLAEAYTIFVEIGGTPLEYREEEKLYYLVNKYKLHGEKIYFTFNMQYAENLSTYKDIKNRDRATFTQKEINALDLSKDWEQVEVE